MPELMELHKPVKTGLRTVIINSALELIADHGFHGTSIQMIAIQAKVGVGSIYRYFNNKDDLVDATFKFVDGKVSQKITNEIRESLPLKMRFVNTGMMVAKYFMNHPYEFKFMEQYYNSPYGFNKKNEELLLYSSESMTSCIDLYKVMFEAAITAGSVKYLPLKVLYSLTFGPIIYLLKDHIAGVFLLDEMMIQKMVEASWDAVENRG